MASNVVLKVKSFSSLVRITTFSFEVVPPGRDDLQKAGLNITLQITSILKWCTTTLHNLKGHLTKDVRAI